MLKRRQGFSVKVSGKIIILTCARGALQSKYDNLKAAIEATNKDYDQEKKEVLALVENDQRARVEAVNIALERQEQIQKELDNLKL